MHTDYARIEAAIGYLEANFQHQPSLKDTAAHVGLSEYHFQRLFRRWAGISPKRFVQYLTAEHARAMLMSSHNVLESAYAVGLSGGSRLYDLTVNIHAMTPGEIQSAGAGLQIRYGVHDSPFGACLLALTERGICAMRFFDGYPTDVLAELRADWRNAVFIENPTATQPYLDAIFGGVPPAQPITVMVKGTNFQVRVWEALLHIPHGAATTYADIAAQIGNPSAVRAVGSAVGKNPIAYLIPCHRVMRKSGIIGEYRWGSRRKKAMLAWEAAHTESV